MEKERRCLLSRSKKYKDHNPRCYDPYITQFTQPDSIIPDPYNPLDWNRYAYARYNPIRYTDPTGHVVQDDLKDGGGWTFYDNWRVNIWGKPFVMPDLPEPKQLTSSTWSFMSITGGMTVGQGGDPVDYSSDYEGQVANNGNHEFYVNNWSPILQSCKYVGGGLTGAVCVASVGADLASRILRPNAQTLIKMLVGT